jgi:hypothetical protein
LRVCVWCVCLCVGSPQSPLPSSPGGERSPSPNRRAAQSAHVRRLEQEQRRRRAGDAARVGVATGDRQLDALLRTNHNGYQDAALGDEAGAQPESCIWLRVHPEIQPLVGAYMVGVHGQGWVTLVSRADWDLFTPQNCAPEKDLVTAEGG